MSEHDPVAKTPTDPPLDGPGSAEDKRLAARRRFLGRGAAAGSGLLIVTLFHRRAFAWSSWDNTTKLNLVSSIEACNSYGGKIEQTWKGAVMYDNSVSSKKPDRYNCIK